MTKGSSKRVAAIKESLEARQGLSRDKQVIDALSAIWYYNLEKDSSLLVTKDTYVKFYSNIASMLFNSISTEKADDLASVCI